MGRNIAPGLGRRFASEAWPSIGEKPWREARCEANDRQIRGGRLSLIGTDVDEASLSMARRHAQAAGVAADIRFARRDFADIAPHADFGCLICNPPYGERSGSLVQAEEIARQAAGTFGRFPTWSIYVLSALPNFERLYRRQADRRRKLYNGPIACTYYQFHGPRPPKAIAPMSTA